MTLKAISCLAVLVVAITKCSSFSPPIKGSPLRTNQWKSGRSPAIFAATADDVKLEQQNQGDDESEMDDESILKTTSKSELTALCEQFNLSTKGTKEKLLYRLRDFAKQQEEAERERLMKRKQLVEEGSDDDREKYEVVDDEIDEEEEDEVFFYYESKATTGEAVDKESKKVEKKKNEEIRRDSGYVTAPPPNAKTNDKGEKVVTIYSTNERNDLTGIAAAQPGQQSFDPLTSSTSEPADAPWDSSSTRKADSSSAEIDAAKVTVTELVRTLLAMTGLPVFINEDEDDDIRPVRGGSKFDAPAECIDFDPSMVPTDMLTKASTSVRTSRGKVLREVLREFELRAIGDDGTAVDNVRRGGGHYRQVTRVRSFLEGFRQAEVRRISRDTVTLLLDKLVSEGIEGLDVTLASMTRSSDDTSGEGGELNDSLLEYLDDTIRQQEKKVEQGFDSTKKISEFERAIAEDPEDSIENLWKVEDEDGERVETFDPNVPANQLALKEEYDKAAEESIPAPILPSSAPEKLLLLLKIVKERLKIEATFSHDEKSQNLRVLAYCLQLKTNALRKEMINKEFGASLDRLDSFQELVASSIEYGESTSHQLQPSKTGALNVPLLKTILKIAKETRKENTYKASGGTAQ